MWFSFFYELTVKDYFELIEMLGFVNLFSLDNGHTLFKEGEKIGKQVV